MKNFKSKLHLACSRNDLRPIMNYIHFIDGYAYATNGTVLLKHKLEAHDFLPEEVEAMNGHCLYWKAFRQILTYTHVEFKKEEGFICKNGFTCVMPSPLSSDIQENNIPFENVISELSSFGDISIEKIGLSLTQTNIINSCLIHKSHGVKMKFNGDNKGIIVTPNNIDNDELYILMPMLIF